MARVNAAETRFLRSDDSETIQAAVDFLCVEGGTVVVPRWNPRTGTPEWRLKKPVVLRSNVTVILDNARLVQETDCFSHLFEAEEGAQNIALVGEGHPMLSGGKESRLKTSTSGKYGLPDIECSAMCLFREVSGLAVENLEFEDPHWFVLVLDHVCRASIRNIRFNSYPLVPEEGGILVRNSSSDIRIENLTGRTGFDSVMIDQEGAGEISGIRIRNVLTDPARGSLVTLNAESGGSVRNVGISVLMDSSDFYEKARSGSALRIGRVGKAEPLNFCGSKAGEGLEESAGTARQKDTVSGVLCGSIYSRAVNAIEISEPASDSEIENLMTFGDNIAAIGSRRSGALSLNNVRLKWVYYGAGSRPNNSNSFISRAAKDAKAVNAPNVSGFTVEKLFLQEEG